MADSQNPETNGDERPAESVNFRPLVVTFGLAGVLALSWRMAEVFRTGWSTPSTFDDAYMFSRYADHLLAGMGMCWNPNGPTTYGCTSLLYTFWVTLIRAVTRIEFWRVTLIASWLAGVGSIVSMAWMCRRVVMDPKGNALSRSPLRSWFAAIAMIALVILPRGGFAFHAGTGMDTTLAIGCNALAIGAALAFRQTVSWRVTVGVGLLVYAAFLARPDSLIYVALFPILLIWFRAEDRNRRVADVIRFGAVVGVLLAADTAIKWAVFGNPLPIPFYAKTGDLYAGYIAAEIWNPVTYARKFLVDNIAAVLIVVVGFRADAWRVVVAALIPVVLTFAYLGTAMQIMGFAARFYYPATPLLIVAAYYVLARWCDRPNEIPVSRPIVSIGGRMVAFALLGVVLFPVSSKAESWYKRRAREQHPNLSVKGLYASVPLPDTDYHAFDVARLIADLVNASPQDAVWAMSEYGYISAAATNVRIFDLAGLHDPDSIDGAPVVQRLFEQRPDVIWFPTRNYTGMVTAIKTHDVFVREYDYWPGAFEWGIAIRRDSAHRDAIVTAMQGAWKKLYHQPVPPPARWIGGRGAESQANPVDEAPVDNPVGETPRDSEH